MTACTTHGFLARTLAAVWGACAITLVAQAQAPQVRTQPPAFYRMMLGDFEITSLNDGVFGLDTRNMLVDPNPPQAATLLEKSFEPRVLPISVNAFLVNTGSQLVLIDTGAATLFGPTLGKLLTNLQASGYRPEQVDMVLITHMHPDHIGGLSLDGARVFGNATVYAERREADFWLNPDALATAPPDRRDFFKGAAAAIQPYAAAGRFKTFRGASDIAPGIRSLPAPGHTPGHTVYAIESRGQTLMVWGDLTEIAAVQFVAPQVTIAFDSDPAATVRSRMRAHADAARSGYLIACSHLPFPGIGHLRAAGAGYDWIPVDYDSVPPIAH
jgi:glyoxylase-like metal-dependent hydrolase (beta-lactamase superfamily II)